MMPADLLSNSFRINSQLSEVDTVRYSRLALVAMILLSFAGCGRQLTPAAQGAPTRTAPPASAAPTPFLIKASIREIMDAAIDPAADVLWDSVAIINGEEKRPRTPEDWLAVRRAAITLIEGTNLIVMDGRRIAPLGAHYKDEADPALLQTRLEASPAPFIAMNQAVREVGLKMLEAIDQHDADRLFALGGDLDVACEACHRVYYYPPDLEPKP